MKYSKAHRQRGVALAEFAIVLPLFLTILLGMIDYGYYFYVAVSASNAAREGARQCTLVSLGACGNCTPTAAITYMDTIGKGGQTTATATCTNTGGTLMYTVNVTVDIPTITGYLTSLGLMPASSTSGNTVTRAVAVMRGQ